MTTSTPDLCDAYPDDVRVLEPILRGYGAVESFGGPAVTVNCFEDNSVVKELVARPGRGRVIVVDGGGSMGVALLGDMLAQLAADNGWAGLLIHGAVRDVEILRTVALGVLALGSIPLRSAKRGLGERDVPVTFGGVTFLPGDYVYADATGVVTSSRALDT